MLFKLEFTVEYPAHMTQRELFAIWVEEAEAALGAKQAGVVKDLWKIVGERRVTAIVEVPDPDTLDRILFDLPIMKKHGQHVDVEVKSIRRYEDFAADVKERFSGDA